MASRSWATVAKEPCTTYVTNNAGKSGKVTTIWEKKETDLTLRPILRRSRPELETLIPLGRVGIQFTH